jgi:hypothetical protein
MENPKHHFLTFKALIIAMICLSATAFAETCGFRNIGTCQPAFRDSFMIHTIVINEIMADPTPLVGLPDAEWIELHNAGASVVQIKGWKLMVGTIVKILPDSIIAAGQYVIICSAQTAPELEKFGTTVVLSTFPALRNSGNLLSLLDASDSVVDRIDYSDSWYGNSSKKNGGWSLERIDPERYCGQPANWSASVHPSGGTPGTVNSIFRKNTDWIMPRITSARLYSPNRIVVAFSESMDTLTLKNRANYFLSAGWGCPDTVNLTDDLSIQLSWGRSFQPNLTYKLSFMALTDLCGNILLDKETEVSWMVLQKGDLVINEILFNPRPGGADFVEIYNRSTQKIALEKLILASEESSGEKKNQTSLPGAQKTILPGEYLALTTDSNGISQFYAVHCVSCIFQVSSLPPFNNDKGTVVLLSDSLLVLDEFSYSEEMHDPLLYDVEGVSLERVNPDKPTRDPTNWQSASSTAGFATPGYKNSQYMAKPLKYTLVTFKQTSISPNNDGFNDELVVDYQTRNPGWMANCRIFDTTGREIIHLLNNALLSTSGKITWDGKNKYGQRLPLGPYIFWIELFDMSGHTERYKEAVILTERGNN